MNRAAFLTLIDMDTEAWKSRVRRGQIPFDIGSRERGRNYTASEAFKVILHNAFVEGLQLGFIRARDVVRAAVPEIKEAWPLIASTSQEMAWGRAVPAGHEVLVGRIQPPGIVEPTAFCAPVAQLAEVIARSPAPAHMVFTNVTRVAATMRTRAFRAGLNLGNFWDRFEYSVFIEMGPE